MYLSKKHYYNCFHTVKFNFFSSTINFSSFLLMQCTRVVAVPFIIDSFIQYLVNSFICHSVSYEKDAAKRNRYDNLTWTNDITSQFTSTNDSQSGKLVRNENEKWVFYVSIVFIYTFLMLEICCCESIHKSTWMQCYRCHNQLRQSISRTAYVYVVQYVNITIGQLCFLSKISKGATTCN